MNQKRKVDPAVYKNMPRLSMMEKLEAANRFCGYVWAGYHEAIAEEFGEEKAVEMGKKAMRIIGQKYLPELSQLLGIQAEDPLLSFARINAFLEEQILAASATTLEASPERVVRQLSYCPWGEVVPRGVCTAMIEGAADMFEPLGVRITHDSMYCDTGACRYTAEKKVK